MAFYGLEGATNLQLDCFLHFKYDSHNNKNVMPDNDRL